MTRRQLLEAGLGSDAIAHRVNAGRLIRVHLGVYAVGHVPITPVARAAAAVLACGEGAVLSHGSAAALWGFRKQWPDLLDVTARTARRRPGLSIHRSSTLARQDVTRHLGVPVTSPARTVYAIAPHLDRKALTRAVNDALLSNFLHLSDLAEVIERNPANNKCNALARELGRRGPTRSELEDSFRDFTERFGLPAPVFNARVAGREVDALFAGEGVIVELDSWRFHGTRSAFESDRERDADMLSAGIPTVRVTWDRLREAPEREAERLKAILGSAPRPQRRTG